MSSLISARSGVMSGCAFLLSLIVLSGCANVKTRYEKVFGNSEQFSHRPAMVMFVNSKDVTKDGARVTIEMDKINVGGVSVKEILDDQREWRLNVFTFDKAKRLAGKDAYDAKRDITLEKLPLGQLLTADIDFHPRKIWKSSEEEVGPNAEVLTYSFLVVLLKHPE